MSGFIANPRIDRSQFAIYLANSAMPGFIVTPRIDGSQVTIRLANSGNVWIYRQSPNGPQLFRDLTSQLGQCLDLSSIPQLTAVNSRFGQPIRAMPGFIVNTLIDRSQFAI